MTKKNKQTEMDFSACINVISILAHPASFAQSSSVQQTAISFGIPLEQGEIFRAEENESQSQNSSVAKSLMLTTKEGNEMDIEVEKKPE